MKIPAIGVFIRTLVEEVGISKFGVHHPEAERFEEGLAR